MCPKFMMHKHTLQSLLVHFDPLDKFLRFTDLFQPHESQRRCIVEFELFHLANVIFGQRLTPGGRSFGC